MNRSTSASTSTSTTASTTTNTTAITSTTTTTTSSTTASATATAVATARIFYRKYQSLSRLWFAKLRGRRSPDPQSPCHGIPRGRRKALLA